MTRVDSITGMYTGRSGQISGWVGDSGTTRRREAKTNGRDQVFEELFIAGGLVTGSF